MLRVLGGALVLLASGSFGITAGITARRAICRPSATP